MGTYWCGTYPVTSRMNLIIFNKIMQVSVSKANSTYITTNL
jgi:hypothetical protein